MIKSGLNIKEKWCFCYLKKFNTKYLPQKWIWYLDINSEKHKMNSQKLTVPLCKTKRQNLHQQKNYSEYIQCHWTVSVEKKIAQCTRYMLLQALHNMRKNINIQTIECFLGIHAGMKVDHSIAESTKPTLFCNNRCLNNPHEIIKIAFIFYINIFLKK